MSHRAGIVVVVMVMVMAVALGGCVNHALPACGDLLCPIGATCLEGRCISREAASACDGQPDATPCTTSQIRTGVCSAGICSVAGCGNGLREAGEACDDANQSSGDGCSERCDSLEICGDGVTNPGEQCDCGTDPATLRAPCVAVNSDTEPRAACRTSCALRSCGDGIVDEPEQCEAGVAITATCAELGFYAGSMSCTPFCRLDASLCSGRCGDGVIQSGSEQCDGTNFGGRTCATYGLMDPPTGPGLQCLGCSISVLGCQPICGDGTCSPGETCNGCLADCCCSIEQGPGGAQCAPNGCVTDPMPLC